MNNTSRHWIRGGARALGAIGGAFAAPFTGGAINPFTGYQIAGQIADTAAPDKEVWKSNVAITNLNPYSEGTKTGKATNPLSTIRYKDLPDNQTFNKGIGLLDTAVQLGSVAAGGVKFDGGTKGVDATGTDKVGTFIRGIFKGKGDKASSLISNAADVNTGISNIGLGGKNAIYPKGTSLTDLSKTMGTGTTPTVPTEPTDLFKIAGNDIIQTDTPQYLDMSGAKSALAANNGNVPFETPQGIVPLTSNNLIHNNTIFNSPMFQATTKSSSAIPLSSIPSTKFNLARSPYQNSIMQNQMNVRDYLTRVSPY